MRRFGLVVVLTIAFVAGLAGTAFAQGGGPGGPGGPGGRGGPGGPGGPGGRQPDACATVGKAVHDACPCNGTDGNGWADHAAFMRCVRDAAAAAVAAGATQECADKAIEHADASPIGTDGFTCPTPGERPAPGDHPRPSECPTGEHPTPDPNVTPDPNATPGPGRGGPGRGGRRPGNGR